MVERELLLNVVRGCQRNVRFTEGVATVHSVQNIFSRGLRALHYSGHGVKDAVTFETGRLFAAASNVSWEDV